MNWSDAGERAVAEDRAREAGTWSPGAMLWRIGLRPFANANADVDAYAYADARADAYAYVHSDANADADADARADADANADADAHSYDDADADGYADDDDDENFISAFSGGEHVRNGLFVWAQPSGGMAVLRIGWLRRVAGDEYEALSMVTPKRAGDYQTMLADLAIDGPPKAWTFTRPIPGACPVNRFAIQGPVPLNPSQWSKISPRPKDWAE